MSRPVVDGVDAITVWPDAFGTSKRHPSAGRHRYVLFADPDIGFQTSSSSSSSAADEQKDCCYEHCADGGLCVLNASRCGADGDDQRPVCVEDVMLPDDGSDDECDMD